MNAVVSKDFTFENRVTSGNVYTVLAGIAAMGMLYGSLTTDFKALAQRVEIGDRRDDKAGDVLDTMRGSVIRIEAEQKAVREEAARIARQLDRIEGLLRNDAAPSQRQQYMNEPPPPRLPLKIP